MQLKKEFRILGFAILCGLAFTFAVSASTWLYSNSKQSALARSVIRFHVLANSDSKEDQSLKAQVRDEILSGLRPELAGSRSIDETRSIIESKLPEIERDAKKLIQAHGYDYQVTAGLSNDFFPTKTYGDITFFPGEYEALRIVIGDGEGENWWCVMFPPLCFVDITRGKVPEEDKRQLKNAAEKEYILLSDEAREKHVTVNIKFKIVEWWQNFSHKEKDKDIESKKNIDGYVIRQSPPHAK